MENFRISLQDLEAFKPVVKNWIKEAISEANGVSSPKFYTRQDIVRDYNVTYPTVLEHIKRGFLVSSRRVGRKYIYSQADIDRYLERTMPNCKAR